MNTPAPPKETVEAVIFSNVVCPQCLTPMTNLVELPGACRCDIGGCPLEGQLFQRPSVQLKPYEVAPATTVPARFEIPRELRAYVHNMLAAAIGPEVFYAVNGVENPTGKWHEHYIYHHELAAVPQGYRVKIRLEIEPSGEIPQELRRRD